MTPIDEIRRELDAHPTWRRVQPRRNDATHPRELPDPADESAHFEHVQRARRAAQRRVRAGEEHEFEPVQATDEGQFFVTVRGGLVFLRPDQVEEVCDLCEEPGTVADPLGHFLDPDDVGEYVIAHGECGLGCELELA